MERAGNNDIVSAARAPEGAAGDLAAGDLKERCGLSLRGVHLLTGQRANAGVGHRPRRPAGRTPNAPDSGILAEGPGRAGGMPMAGEKSHTPEGEGSARVLV
jgi:hypothetical protein